MLNNVNTSLCKMVYGMHPFMSLSTSFTLPSEDAEVVCELADEKLLSGAKKPLEEILAESLFALGLEAVDDAAEDLEQMTPFAAVMADIAQTWEIMGISTLTHKAMAYFAEFVDEDLADNVLVTLVFVANDADDIKLK